MRTLARMGTVSFVLAASLIVSLPASAKSVKDFEQMPAAEQSKYLADFVEKMTTDLGRSNPKLELDIRDYFVKKQPGKPVSEGVEKVSVELSVVDMRAKEGKADLSNIQIESIVVYVVKQKFPPPRAQK